MNKHCPICDTQTESHCRIPFDTSQDGQDSPSLALAATLFDYHCCPSCGHAFAPQLLEQSPDWFAAHIYNDDYRHYDADYLDAEQGRIKYQSNALVFGYHFARKQIRHLDYGSGDSNLSKKLQTAGFDSTPYDPFSQTIEPTGRFNLITAFEVIEHAPDPNAFLSSLEAFMDTPCLIRIGTAANDGEDVADWWYAKPRVGHINLFSRKSMATLATRHRLNLSVASNSDFFLWRNLPEWAKY